MPNFFDQFDAADPVPLPRPNPIGRLQPEFRTKFADIRTAAGERGVHFDAPTGGLGGVRTQEQQDGLYAQGRTMPGYIVTQTRNSNHIGGRALDVVPREGTTSKEIGDTLTDLSSNDPRFAGTRSGATFRGLHDPLHVELNTPQGQQQPTAMAQAPQSSQGVLGAISGQRTAQATPQPQASAPQQASANFFDQFDASAGPAPFNERFAPMQSPGAKSDELREGLLDRSMAMTRGPAQSPMGQMVTEHENTLAAARQGTVPHVDEYRGRLISTDVFQNDAGQALYRDPQTGELKETDKSKQVALQDSVDGRWKIYERSEATDESTPVGIARTLIPGLVAGAPTSRMGSAAAKVVKPQAQDIIATAKPSYQAFEAIAANTKVAADEAKNMVDRVQGALDAAHFPSEVSKQVHDTVALIAKKGDTALDQLQYVKRAVGNLFKSPDENVRKAAGVATREIGRIIQEASPTAAANLKRADAIHQTGRAKQVLETDADIASLRTGRAGYGGNAVNNMRTFVEKIVEKDAKGFKTPFKPDEVQFMRDITEGNWLTNTLRTVGGLAPSKGGIQLTAAIGTLGASAAVGAAGNKLATILTKRQLNQLEELVAKRSPAYSEAVTKAIERYNTAQMAIAAKPSPNSLAGYISASRALSAGLTRDGIQVSSGDLLRAIQNPMKSAAEGEEPAVPGRPGE